MCKMFCKVTDERVFRRYLQKQEHQVEAYTMYRILQEKIKQVSSINKINALLYKNI
jgi:hypothetical protein